MRTNIKATSIELTEAIKDAALSKFESVGRLVSEAATLEIEVGKTTARHQKGEVFRTEANLTAEGHLFRAEATGVDLYATMDEAKEELVREVKSLKGKRESLTKRGARAFKKLLRLD